MLDLAKMKRLRTKLGMTQEDAARKAGWKNRQAWSLIESGTRKNVGMDLLDRIAKALHVRPRELIKK